MKPEHLHYYDIVLMKQLTILHGNQFSAQEKVTAEQDSPRYRHQHKGGPSRSERDDEGFRFGHLPDQILAISSTTTSIISIEVVAKCAKCDGKPPADTYDIEAGYGPVFELLVQK